MNDISSHYDDKICNLLQSFKRYDHPCEVITFLCWLHKSQFHFLFSSEVFKNAAAFHFQFSIEISWVNCLLNDDETNKNFDSNYVVDVFRVALINISFFINWTICKIMYRKKSFSGNSYFCFFYHIRYFTKVYWKVFCSFFIIINIFLRYC